MKTKQEQKAEQWSLIKPKFEKFVEEVRKRVEVPVFYDIDGLESDSEYFHPTLTMYGEKITYQCDIKDDIFYGNPTTVQGLIDIVNKLKIIERLQETILIQSDKLKAKIKILNSELEKNENKYQFIKNLSQYEKIKMINAFEILYPEKYDYKF